MKQAQLHLSLLATLAIACGHNAVHTEPELTFYSTVDRGRGSHDYTDTLAVLDKHSSRDSLVGSTTFTWGGVEHTVTGWNNDHYAPVDGGGFWLELDSLGTIFGHSTTWPGFSVVHSNNDSLNQLITMALAAASRPGRFGVRYTLPPTPKIEIVNFTQLEIHDTTLGVNWGK